MEVVPSQGTRIPRSCTLTHPRISSIVITAYPSDDTRP